MSTFHAHSLLLLFIADWTQKCSQYLRLYLMWGFEVKALFEKIAIIKLLQYLFSVPLMHYQKCPCNIRRYTRSFDNVIDQALLYLWYLTFFYDLYWFINGRSLSLTNGSDRLWEDQHLIIYIIAIVAIAYYIVFPWIIFIIILIAIVSFIFFIEVLVTWMHLTITILVIFLLLLLLRRCRFHNLMRRF